MLKGCSLRCKWCSNPESIHPKPELAYNPRNCIGEQQCGFCLKGVCPESAIYGVGTGDRADDTVQINWDLCTDCGLCVPVCPTHALYLFGQDMTVDQVLAEVEQDSAFYRESGGGITVSGGECQLQADFLAALLAEAHRRGINTAIETAFSVPWAFVEKVLPHVDVVLHDHKLTDSERHRKWTGAPYKNVIDYELLPYMRFGESKYGFLGRVYEMQDFDPPTPETLQRLRAIIDEAFGRATSAARD